jgi:polyhydroxyalkanoate synthase subunit PhaC
LSKRLTAALAHRKAADPSLHGPSGDVYMKAAAAYVAEMMQNPSKILEHQINYWGKTLKHYVEAQQVLAKGELKAPPIPRPRIAALPTRCGKRTPSSTTSSSNTC